MVSAILWPFVCLFNIAWSILSYLLFWHILLVILVASWTFILLFSYPIYTLSCRLPFTTEMCNSTWCSTSDPSPIFSIKESIFAEAINSTHNGFTNALYEVNPLVTLPYRLHYTDDRLQDARWLIESSEIPSRTPLIQVIVQHLETSGHVRDDLSMFIAQVEGKIDFVLLITDWTIQDLTRIAQHIQMPKNPSVADATLSTQNDFIPYNHGRILFNYVTAVILSDFVLRSYKAFYRSFPKASADTAIRSVVSTFVMYIDEISPRIIVLTSQADELLANIKRLQTNLDNIHSVLVHDTRSLSTSRAVIEDQR